MSDAPFLVFSARPSIRVRVRSIFEDGPVQGLLENPGQIRDAGWDLHTRDRARIVRGEYVEVARGDRKKIQLYEDGALIARISASYDSLGWGPRNETEFAARPRINPLALIEFTFNFVDLYRRITEYFHPTGASHIFTVSVRDASATGHRVYMTPFGVDTWAWMLDDDRFVAPDDQMDREISVEHTLLLSHSARVAYLIVRTVYVWFGIPTNKIPYVSDTDGMMQVDTAKIVGSSS